jgi:phospholipid-translocating ATPase
MSSQQQQQPSSPCRTSSGSGEGPATPSPPQRPQLHIDTSPATPSSSLYTTPLGSRTDGRRSSFDNDADNNLRPPSSTGSLRSQRSDQLRVRFSADVQTLGERALTSPSITADEALARLSHSPAHGSLNRRQGNTVADLPYLPSSSASGSTPEQPRGILRSPMQLSPPPSSSSSPSFADSQRRPTRPRGWSLRRQLFSKQEPPVSPLSSADIGLAILPPHDIGSTAKQPAVVPSVQDVDAIRVVTTALEQALIDPPVAFITPKSPGTTKISSFEPQVTQASLPFYSKWAASRRTTHFLGERVKGVMRQIKRLRDPRLRSKGKGREIPIDVSERGHTNLVDERTGRDYCNNLITSSRYTVFSFLPRQLWAQFSKVANLYSFHILISLTPDTF